VGGGPQLRGACRRAGRRLTCGLAPAGLGRAPRLLALLGGVLVHAGEVDDAEARYRQALELRPDDPALMSNVALLLAERGELGEARRLAEKATTLAPNDTVAAQVLEHIRSKN